MPLGLRASAALFATLAFAGAASSQVVINEVVYDAPGADDGQVFVELFGPAGTDISNWRIQSIEGGTSAGTCNPQSFTFPASTLIGASGYVVVADTDTNGNTTVPNPTFTSTNMDLENGSDAVQLLDATGALIDAVAYGPTTGTNPSTCNNVNWFEGSPARDVFAPLSIERCPAGRDTGNNATDFTPNTPTPGTGDACCSAIEWVDLGTGNTLDIALGEAVGLDFWSSCSPNQPFIVIASFVDPAVTPPPPPFPVFDPAATGVLAGLVNLGPFVNWGRVLGPNGDYVGQAQLNFAGLGLSNLSAPTNFYLGMLTFDQSFNFTGTNYVTIVLQ